MKILGISGSPRPKEQSAVYRLVETVLENTGMEYELISLRNKSISGCIACLGCVKDNVCKVEDDFTPIREKIVKADAYVVGAPNYYSTINAASHAFFERWFQFRHQAGNHLWGKLAVTVGAGGTSGRIPADCLETFLLYNFIETVAKVHGQGAASCYSCGYGESCQVGIPNMLHGPGVKITEDMIPDVKKQPDVMAAAVNAGRLLASRLQSDHDRLAVTDTMQAKMMSMFESAV
ncbi:flavodoxin family protein [Desulforhopalus singaporensis]|uniref:NADPH-dependent FMN reductase n=1 Tax=Desulforhopalus singaporensis TaxID=91360 RepID=A0A1H0UB50_9BACT|nr:flavodoxin family protein [Desulforhopalus singaporensis]SDP63409.1 NADPH-dependent FMN reductase [Desulforhopalus singaporensis]